jgi:hypothetical protein
MTCKPGDIIRKGMRPHLCAHSIDRHEGCFEIDSDTFIEATRVSERRYDGTPLAPD